MSVIVKHFNKTGNKNEMSTIFSKIYLMCYIQSSDDVFGVSYGFLPPEKYWFLWVFQNCWIKTFTECFVISKVLINKKYLELLGGLYDIQSNLTGLLSK